MTTTCDKSGRPWAKLSELKEGDIGEVDGGFDGVTMRGGVVHSSGGRLYILCSAGRHYLADQADDGEHCVGVYAVFPVKPAETT